MNWSINLIFLLLISISASQYKRLTYEEIEDKIKYLETEYGTKDLLKVEEGFEKYHISPRGHCGTELFLSP